MATMSRMLASAPGILERLLLEQIEHPAGIDLGREAKATPLGIVVAVRERGLQIRFVARARPGTFESA